MRSGPIIPSLLLLLWLLPAQGMAEPQNDIKLIIDVSGSMKKNDPENLRRPAVNLLMNLLPENARAGVWLFGDKIEVLVPYGEVTPSFKANAVTSSQQIHSRGLLTDIGGALEQSMLGKAKGGKAILLSDGMVDLGPDEAVNLREQERIRDQLVPQLVSENAEVHTVALSENADKQTLQTIAQQTGGLFEVARTADDLTRIFLTLFDDAVIQDRLPMEGGRFFVDSSVEEFTLLAFRSPDSTPIQLKSPNNDYYLADDHPDTMGWYHDSGYVLITVPRPTEGEWRLFAEDDPQNRVTVLSDLKLDVNNLANALHEASFPELVVRFIQQDEVIDDPTFLRLMDVQLIVVTPAGKRVAKPLNDPASGIFRSNLDVFAEPGRYRISVNVDGKSFRREVVQEVEYGSPARVVYSDVDGLVTVRPVAPGLLEDDLHMVARLEAVDGTKKLIPLAAKEGVWQASLASIAEGNYQLSVSVKGIARTGQSINFTLQNQSIQIVQMSEPLLPESNSWGPVEYGIAIGAGFINLLLAGFAFWYLRRRGKDQGPDDTEEIEELLMQAPAAGSGKDADLNAALAEAAALREQANAPEQSAPEQSAPEQSAPEELTDSVGGMSDIVDAWNDPDDHDVYSEPSANKEPSADKEPSANIEPTAELDKEPLANKEPSVEEDELSPIATEQEYSEEEYSESEAADELETATEEAPTSAPAPNDDPEDSLPELSDDEALMAEFQQAVNEQVGDPVDEHAETVSLDDPIIDDTDSKDTAAG